MKHIDDHDAVIRAVNTSDFQADSVTDTFKSPDKTDDSTTVCVSFILFQTILFRNEKEMQDYVLLFQIYCLSII